MKKPVTVFILVSLASFAGMAILAPPSFLSQSSPAKTQFNLSGDNLDEFVGAVKSFTVEIETHEFTSHFIDNENRYKRKPFKTSQFDRTGKKIEEFHYRRDEVHLPKVTYTYDKNGRLHKENHYSATTGEPHFETIYIYDQLGRLKEKFGKGIKENKPLSREVYSYDQGKNYIEVTEYGSNNVMSGKLRVKLDSKGRMSEVASLAPGNEILGEVTAKYDEKGNLAEMAFSMSDGSPMTREKYTYEFDTHGNWIKKNLYHWVSEDGKSFDKLMDITHRIITYY